MGFCCSQARECSACPTGGCGSEPHPPVHANVGPPPGDCAATELAAERTDIRTGCALAMRRHRAMRCPSERRLFSTVSSSRTLRLAFGGLPWLDHRTLLLPEGRPWSCRLRCPAEKSPRQRRSGRRRRTFAWSSFAQKVMLPRWPWRVSQGPAAMRARRHVRSHLNPPRASHVPDGARLNPLSPGT